MESAVTFVLRNAFSPRPHICPQNTMRRLESVSGAADARFRCAVVMVNGLGAAAAIFENQRPCKPPASPKVRLGWGTPWAPDKCFVRNTLRVTDLDRILWLESCKVLSSKDLRLSLSYVQ